MPVARANGVSKCAYRLHTGSKSPSCGPPTNEEQGTALTLPCCFVQPTRRVRNVAPAHELFRMDGHGRHQQHFRIVVVIVVSR
eukprot:1030661-Prorocentrum_minimum.AAC.1